MPTPSCRRRLSCPRFIPLFLVLSACLGFAAARGAGTDLPAIAPAPDWTVAEAWTRPEKFTENTSGEDFLLLDEQTRLASEETYRHNVYQIVTDSGRQHASQVYIYFDPSYQQLTIHHIRLVRGDEVIDKLDPAKIQIIQQERELDRQLYNGQRSALLILEDVRIGDILDVAYTLRGTNPVFAGRFIDTMSLEWGVPVRNLRYRLLVPAGRRIATKSIGPTSVTPTIEPLGGGQELTWRRANVPIVERDDRTPGSHVAFSFLDVSEFNGWGDVVEWAGPLYAPDPAQQAVVDEAVAGIRARAKTPGEQALAALAFVQQEIRYLGIEMGPGSHRPSAPAEVLRRRFGDCKDKSRLLTALLQGLGLEAAPALVNSSYREAGHDRLPTPYAFDHVIVALDLAGRRYLLDPTLSYQRGDDLAMRHIGRYGPYLRVAEGNAGLGDAPLGPGDTNRTEIRQVFDVTALEQPATFTVTTTAWGRAADNLRAYFAVRSLDQISKEYLDYYTYHYHGITLQQPVEHADNPKENTYTTTEHYQVAQLFARESGGSVLRAEFEPPGVLEYVRIPNVTQRKQPLALKHPLHLDESITVNLPEDWPVTPYAESVEDEAFVLKAEARNPTPRQVVLRYQWDSKAYQVAATRLPVFSLNAEKARKSLGYQLSWRSDPKPAATPAPTQTAAVPDDGPPLNWPMIGLAAAVLLAGFQISWHLVRKTNPAPAEPPADADPAKPADPYSRQAREEALQAGIGGWLFLVAFGLIVRPAVLLYQIQSGYQAYFNSRVWERLTTPGGEYYNAHFALVAPLELIFNLVLLIYSVLLLVLFFRRSYLFPRLIQIFFLCAIGGAIFSIWDTAMLSPKEEAFNTENIRGLLQALLGSAVWIPYFRVSRRVKRTFVL